VIRVLVVDDEGLVRTGLRLILEAEDDIRVVGEAADGAAAMDAIRRTEIDVVLMDIRMAGVGGLETARQIAAVPRGPRVLIVTAFDLDEHIDEALRVGVAGFMVKAAPRQELVAGVRAVAAGDAFLSPSVARRVVQALVRGGIRISRRQAELDSLSEREREVLDCVARGLSNREIASELAIRETTVRTHVGHVLMKLNLRDRTQAAVRAVSTRKGSASPPGPGTRPRRGVGRA
jgi:DNA-binding NarL/FixJ family response regulator